MSLSRSVLAKLSDDEPRHAYDIASELGLEGKRVAQVLSQLVGHGRARRTGRGLYVLGDRVGRGPSAIDVIFALVKASPKTTGEIAALCPQYTYQQVRDSIAGLRTRLGLIQQRSPGQPWGLTGAPLPPPSDRTRVYRRRPDVAKVTALPPKGLPMLELGVGERRDCARDKECLDRFVARFPRLSNCAARCPARCAFFAPPKTDTDHYAAQRFGSSAGVA